jgi:hypothetical protein
MAMMAAQQRPQYDPRQGLLGGMGQSPMGQMAMQPQGFGSYTPMGVGAPGSAPVFQSAAMYPGMMPSIPQTYVEVDPYKKPPKQYNIDPVTGYPTKSLGKLGTTPKSGSGGGSGGGSSSGSSKAVSGGPVAFPDSWPKY